LLHGQVTPAEVPVYNETLTIRRTCPLNLVALERTLAEMIRRNEIWRTTFELHEGQPVQVIHAAEAGFRLPLIDLRDIQNSNGSEKRYESLVRWRGRRSTSRGTTVPSHVGELGECDHRLFLTFHQLIFDGVTAYQVFLPEMDAIYGAFSRNQPSRSLSLASNLPTTRSGSGNGRSRR